MISKKLFLQRLEIALVATLLPIHLMFYNFIGLLSSQRGINYGYILAAPIENMLPIWPWLGPFYLFIWIYPILVIIYFIFKKGYDFVFFRELYLGFLSLMILAYLFWLAFPVEFTDRLSDTQLAGYGWSGQILTFIYHGATPWNAFPSFHIAVVWFLYRTNQFFIKQHSWLFYNIVILTIWTTLVIRIHYVFDSLGGIFLAELAFLLVTVRLSKLKWLRKGSNITWISIYAVVFIVAVLIRFFLGGLLK